jgi:hypothetical protein
MSLLQEAELDDQFNTQLSKIQEAIIKLEKLAGSFNKNQHWPVRTQIRGLEVAHQDLDKLVTLYSGLRT